MESRYERKFLIENLNYHEVKNILILNNMKFSRSFEDRYINNIYLDDMNLSNYRDNIEGNTIRSKTRIRWYGDLLGINSGPNLEIKKKRGEVGFKEKLQLNDFNFDEEFQSQIEGIRNNLKDMEKLHLISQLRPTLVNRYKRSYYVSYDGDFRITLDQNLEFFPFFNKKISLFQRYENKRMLIVELKYSKNVSNNANDISNQFPFRLTKSSKYIMGIDKIRPYFF